jgi:hypothetical protein
MLNQLHRQWRIHGNNKSTPPPPLPVPTTIETRVPVNGVQSTNKTPPYLEVPLHQVHITALDVRGVVGGHARVLAQTKLTLSGLQADTQQPHLCM